MTKQIVHYEELASDIQVGYPAMVYPIDHPSEYVSNKQWAMTSPVVEIGDCGTFWTQNTEYRQGQRPNA
jgi:hypothetical protein